MTTSAASSTTLRRLMKEYQTEQKQEQEQQEQHSLSLSSSSSSPQIRKQAARDENILSLRPKDAELKDLLHWAATIKGPQGGCYEGEEDILISKAKLSIKKPVLTMSLDYKF